MTATNARLFFENTLPARLTEKGTSGLTAVFQFHIDGDNGGSWSVDLTKEESWITEEVCEAADCTLAMKEETLLGIINRSVNPQMAFMLGKLKITGNIGLSLKIPKLLG
jgi:putative sterol carrier protein